MATYAPGSRVYALRDDDSLVPARVEEICPHAAPDGLPYYGVSVPGYGVIVLHETDLRPRDTHRAPRRRKTARRIRSNVREPIAAGIALSANPNLGKRSAARMSLALDGTVSREAGAQGKRHAYSPLTVSHPIPRARIAPKTSSYTI